MCRLLLLRFLNNFKAHRDDFYKGFSHLSPCGGREKVQQPCDPELKMYIFKVNLFCNTVHTLCLIRNVFFTLWQWTVFPPTCFTSAERRNKHTNFSLKNCYCTAGGEDVLLSAWALQAPQYQTTRIKRTRFDEDDYNWKHHAFTARLQGATTSHWLTAAVPVKYTS